MKYLYLFVSLFIGLFSFSACAAPMNFTTPHDHSGLAKGGKLGSVSVADIEVGTEITFNDGTGNETDIGAGRLRVYDVGNEYTVDVKDGRVSVEGSVSNEYAQIYFDYMQIRSPSGPDAYISPDYLISRETISQYSMMDHDEIYIGTTNNARRIRIRNDISESDPYIEIRDTGPGDFTTLREDGLTVYNNANGDNAVLSDSALDIQDGAGTNRVQFVADSGNYYFTGSELQFNDLDVFAGVSAAKVAETSVSSQTVVQNDPHLYGYDLEPGTYAITGYLRYWAASPTPDIKMAFRGSCTTVSIFLETNDGQQAHVIATDSDTAVFLADSAERIVNVTGTVTCAVPTTFGLAWSQNVLIADSTRMGAGSWLKAERVGG